MGAGFASVFGVPESTPTSMPFSVTIRLNTSQTERTPWPGFQSYLPDITRASPVNLSESVPASFPKAPCIPTDCAWANGTISDRKRTNSVLSQNLHHVELLFVTTPAHWTICREEPVFAGKVTCGVRSETSGQSWPSNTVATGPVTGLSS